MPDLAKVGPVGRGALQADFCILVTSPMLFKIYIIFLVIDPKTALFSWTFQWWRLQRGRGVSGKQ